MRVLSITVSVVSFLVLSCEEGFVLSDGGSDGDVSADADDSGDVLARDDADEIDDVGLDADDADTDTDTNGPEDADLDDDELLMESCDFGYEEIFPLSLVIPAGRSERSERAGLDEQEVGQRVADMIAHAEPRPPYTYRLVPKAPDDPDIIIPGYSDTMSLFERGGSWDTETRCYETPQGVVLLNETEAYELYRDIAELTTDVVVDDRLGVRTVVGLRGAFPGTFEWHGNRPNYFNDTLVLLWLDDEGVPHVREFPVHTDVGARNFGYHSSSSLRPNRRYFYINGWHNDYNALHIDEIDYRVRDDSNHNGHWDSDRNGWLPPATEADHDRTGGGHNIHMGSVDGPLGDALVDGWSAGCQVIPGIANWTEFINHAWTQMGDRVNYFLIDVRDIEPEVWEPCAERDGSHRCPFVIEDLPFVDARETSGGHVDVFDLYSCSDADESGPEFVYLLTIDRSGTLSVSVDCPEGVDIDVHLLDGDDPMACLTRAHIAFDYAITPGRYLITADSFVDSGVELAGPFTLHIDLN